MAVTSAYQTYGDVSRVEDVVLNAIELLTAQETSILTMLRKTEAKDTVHAYLTDTLSTPASSAVQQGADYSFNSITPPARLTNIVEEVARPFRITQVQNDVSHYQGGNETERQVVKAMKEWGNSAEFDLVRSTLVSGVSGTVAKMSGIIEAISKSTNTTAHTSGTVFSASILDGLMEDNWDNSNGDVATDLFVGGSMRRTIDGFVAKSNVVVNGDTDTGRKLIRTVTSYETAFGTLMIHKHRFVQQSADANARVLAIRPDKLAVAYLRRPFIDTELARSGAYLPRAVYGSLTLEVNNQDSCWFATGFLK